VTGFEPAACCLLLSTKAERGKTSKLLPGITRPEEMPERHNHGKNIIGTIRIIHFAGVQPFGEAQDGSWSYHLPYTIKDLVRGGRSPITAKVPPPEQPSGSIPPLVTSGAPVNTKFQYTFTKGNSLVCSNEYVKVSATEWYERPTSQSPAACVVDVVIFKYAERVSDDARYILLYDESRNLLARISDTKGGEISPTEWRLVSSQVWNVGHSVTKVETAKVQ